MINEYVEKIMRNGIVHFAEQLERPTNEVQILIIWDSETNEVRYKRMVRDGESVYVKFNDILNVKFDLMNREAICGSFIHSTLKKYASEYDCEMSNLYVVIYLVESDAYQDENDVKLFLYKNSLPLKNIELNEILS
jgi:hypothetical protein